MDCCPHPALEPLPLFEGQSVGLGDDGNHVDLVVDGLHELNIQGLQAGCTGDTDVSAQRQTAMDRWCWDRGTGFAWQDSPVAERRDEVEAAVNSVVDDVPAVESALVVEVALKLVVDVADDGVETGRGKFISVRHSQCTRAREPSVGELRGSVDMHCSSSLLTSLGC